MKKAQLDKLKMNTRNEVLAFLKKLWNSEEVSCSLCGNDLEPLHKKAKKNDCDWQCRKCETVFRTIDLLNELNEKMPD